MSQPSVNAYTALPRGQRGWQRKVDKLTWRLYTMQELVKTLESQCRAQTAIIQALLLKVQGRGTNCRTK